ncbi:unnamed protein product [Closterium sp. NIES-64]|nr:unnamed protein product [Closterium sp. NIES-64]
MVRLQIEFSGGLELLFGGEKKQSVDVTVTGEDGQLSMAPLLAWMRVHMLKERPEMFLKGPTVRPGVLVLMNDVDWELTGNIERPGVLVLINDVDWELTGNLESTVEDGDRVTFISTLHGG